MHSYLVHYYIKYISPNSYQDLVYFKQQKKPFIMPSYRLSKITDERLRRQWALRGGMLGEG